MINADDYFLIDSAYMGQSGQMSPLGGESGQGDAEDGSSEQTLGLLDALAGLTIDLRERTTGAKSVSITDVGQIITIDVFATVRGLDAEQYQALDLVEGSFLTSNIGDSVALGLFRAYVAEGFKLQGYSNGTAQDLDGDGDEDVGSDDPSSPNGYWIARSGGAVAPTAGAEYTWLIGTVKFRVDQILGGGGSIEINFVKRGDNPEAALWVEDGDVVNGMKDGSSGDFHIGEPVVLTVS